MEEENEQYYELSTDGWIVKHRPTLNTNVLNEQGRFDPVKAMFDTSDDITYFIACPRIVDEEFSDVNNFKEWPLSFYLRYIVQTESLPTCDLGMYLSRIEDFGEPYYVLDLFEESELEKNPILKEQFEDVPLPTDPFLPYNCSGFIAALINLARNYKYYRLAQFEPNPHCPIRLSELDFYLFDIYPEFYQAYYDHVWSYYKQNYHYLYPESINEDGVDPYMYSTEKLFYDDFTNSLIYNEFPEDQRKRIQKYYNAFMLFLKNRIGYDPEEQETEQKEELPQPEPEQHKDEKVHRYFTTNYTEQQAEQYFTILVKDGYFHSNSKLQDFLYYCGVDNSVQQPSAKLIWMKTQTLLAYFIHEELGKNDLNELWKITKEVFVLKDRTPLNTDSMKQDFSKGISRKSRAEWEKLAVKLK